MAAEHRVCAARAPGLRDASIDSRDPRALISKFREMRQGGSKETMPEEREAGAARMG